MVRTRGAAALRWFGEILAAVRDRLRGLTRPDDAPAGPVTADPAALSAPADVSSPAVSPPAQGDQVGLTDEGDMPSPAAALPPAPSAASPHQSATGSEASAGGDAPPASRPAQGDPTALSEGPRPEAGSRVADTAVPGRPVTTGSAHGSTGAVDPDTAPAVDLRTAGHDTRPTVGEGGENGDTAVPEEERGDGSAAADAVPDGLESATAAEPPADLTRARTKFEQQVGAHHHADPAALTAARSAVVRLREVLHAAYPPPGHSAEVVDGSFFTTDPTSAGQTALDPDLTSTEALDRLLTDGSVRELMTAFFNAAGKKALYEGNTDVPSLTSVLRSVLDPGDGATAGTGMRLAGQLDLNRPALETYARFLHGGARDGLQKEIDADPELRGQAHLFSVSDPFALGSLAAHSTTGAVKDPWEIVRSQLSRVPRPVGERETGPWKKVPRDYTYLGARLTDGERAFLSRHEQPLSLLGYEYQEIPPDTLTFDRSGNPDVTEILSRPNVSAVRIRRTSGAVASHRGAGLRRRTDPRHCRTTRR
jgi:hypothetical protein